jgi:hypothetical protein
MLNGSTALLFIFSIEICEYETNGKLKKRKKIRDPTVFWCRHSKP